MSEHVLADICMCPCVHVCVCIFVCVCLCVCVCVCVCVCSRHCGVQRERFTSTPEQCVCVRVCARLYCRKRMTNFTHSRRGLHSPCPSCREGGGVGGRERVCVCVCMCVR